MTEEIKVGEMFAGIGGFRLGLERANQSLAQAQVWEGSARLQFDEQHIRPNGDKSEFKVNRGQGQTDCFRVVWANEWDKYACQIYRKNFGEKELIEGDIREVKTTDIPDIDLLCAGFPCQSFSIAGKRKGTDESRGTLFAQIVRVASAKRPSLLLLENVRGLLSSDDGGDFAKILRSLGSLGYLLEWQVLNSKYFGVPQNRERVFIVGHLRDTGSRQIFPVECDGEEDNGIGEVAGTLQGGGHSGGLHSNMTGIISHSVRSGGRANLVVSNCLDRDGYLRTGARPRDENGKPQLLPIGFRRIRRLTPVECERLQSFSDGWTEGVSDTQRYKCLGNAVTVNVIEFLGQQIISSIQHK